MNNKKTLFSNRTFVLLSVVVYSLISGLGGLLAVTIFKATGVNYVYYMLMGLIVQCLLVLWAFYVYKKIGKKEKLFQPPNTKNLLWLLPHFVILIILFFVNIGSLSTFDNTKLVSIGIYFFTCIFIGISEEVMFRGAILQYFSSIGKRKAVIYSALLFSLFHVSNILISKDLASTLSQLLFTFIFGLFAAGVVIRQKSLIPIILFHSLWDFVTQITIYSGSSSELTSILLFVVQPLNLLIGLILLFTLSEKKG